MFQSIFYRALLISFLIHCCFLVYLSVTHLKVQKEISKMVEITYQASKPTPKPKVEEEKKVEIKRIETKQKMNLDILEKKGQSFDLLDAAKEAAAKSPIRMEGEQKAVIKVGSAEMSKQMEITMLNSEKITNPKYLSYNDMVRQRIRQKAYIYIDNPDFQSGEVYLTFVLSSNGTLKEAKIIGDKTKANDYLQRIGIKSIEESSPFPPFPKDLTYPELTFNVVISFEVHE